MGQSLTLEDLKNVKCILFGMFETLTNLLEAFFFNLLIRLNDKKVIVIVITMN